MSVSEGDVCGSDKVRPSGHGGGAHPFVCSEGLLFWGGNYAINRSRFIKMSKWQVLGVWTLRDRLEVRR